LYTVYIEVDTSFTRLHTYILGRALKDCDAAFISGR